MDPYAVQAAAVENGSEMAGYYGNPGTHEGVTVEALDNPGQYAAHNPGM